MATTQNTTKSISKRLQRMNPDYIKVKGKMENYLNLPVPLTQISARKDKALYQELFVNSVSLSTILLFFLLEFEEKELNLEKIQTKFQKLLDLNRKLQTRLIKLDMLVEKELFNETGKIPIVSLKENKDFEYLPHLTNKECLTKKLFRFLHHNPDIGLKGNIEEHAYELVELSNKNWATLRVKPENRTFKLVEFHETLSQKLQKMLEFECFRYSHFNREDRGDSELLYQKHQYVRNFLLYAKDLSQGNKEFKSFLKSSLEFIFEGMYCWGFLAKNSQMLIDLRSS